MGCLVLLFLLLSKKKYFGKVLEYLALFWFKIAVSIVVLFVGNIILNSYGISIPINVFSILTLSLLGIPGALCISFLVIMK
ncbi:MULTISPECIES: pro-sigmaK processing inhibitor BofA family protein [unclassified Lysinibacillus]|uniref:pro-sigmaK processing inhibitor BofA family protein n=2 Tax=unclassified Lysinibacillus TaxID=2636778 RepID=UPI001F1046CC|nr:MULTISPECIES: pro-sigmaK processing inhibitor BofA family protein [unclassified Lysinibacillus]